MTPAFRTKQGRLTHYALACGYIEECEPMPGVTLRLWHEGGPAIHVRAHSHNQGRLFWESFDTLTDARRCYDKAKRELKGYRTPAKP